MRAVRCALLCAAATFSCGCGLVFVPHCRTLPAKPLRSVVVTDLDTGEPIEDATVYLRIERYEGCFSPDVRPDWKYAVGGAPLDQEEDGSKAESDFQQWPAQGKGGTYELAAVRKIGWWRIWYPFPHHPSYCSWRAVVVVDTQSHGSVSLGNGVARLRGDLGAPYDYYLDGQRIKSRWLTRGKKPIHRYDLPPGTKLARAVVEEDRLVLALPRVESESAENSQDK